ncbi:MAG TPA: hypothetical protein VG797_05855 [Phycisphaerales bacterium]|nr:hypothetical protein [Phycisphaerales bacterium]
MFNSRLGLGCLVVASSLCLVCPRGALGAPPADHPAAKSDSGRKSTGACTAAVRFTIAPAHVDSGGLTGEKTAIEATDRLCAAYCDWFQSPAFTDDLLTTLNEPNARKEVSLWASTINSGEGWDTDLARKDLRKRFSARLVPNTWIVELSATGRDPEMVRELLRYVSMIVIEKAHARQVSDDNRSINDITEQVRSLTKSLQAIDVEMESIRSTSQCIGVEHPTAMAEKEVELLLTHLIDVRLALAAARADSPGAPSAAGEPAQPAAPSADVRRLEAQEKALIPMLDDARQRLARTAAGAGALAARQREVLSLAEQRDTLLRSLSAAKLRTSDDTRLRASAVYMIDE